MKKALWAVFVLGIVGTLFSGTLTYQEIFGSSAVSCPAPGAPGTVFGFPACIYGFFMYLAVTIAAGLGLRAKR